MQRVCVVSAYCASAAEHVSKKAHGRFGTWNSAIEELQWTKPNILRFFVSRENVNEKDPMMWILHLSHSSLL